MAGTMPHAIFIETGLDGRDTVAAYAAGGRKALLACADRAGGQVRLLARQVR